MNTVAGDRSMISNVSGRGEVVFDASLSLLIVPVSFVLFVNHHVGDIVVAF